MSRTMGSRPAARRRSQCPGGAAVLPDDGLRERPATRPLPEQGRLALVGDPDSRDLACAHSGLGQHLAGRPELGLPEQLGVVLDPTRLRIVLGMLLLGHPQQGRVLVEEQGAGAGRTLVKGEEVAHGRYVILSGRVGRQWGSRSS